MKKILLLTIPALMLAACNQKNTEQALKIICPTGAPAFAFYNYSQDSNFETNAVPSNIVSMLSEASDKDVVVIDTVSGVKAINNGAPYKLAATITFGNFFIASTGNDNDGMINEGDKIVLFGEHQTPDLLFHYLYGDYYDEGIEYVGNVQDAAKCLISGKNAVTGSNIDYVFVAQPVLYNAMQKNENVSVFQNVQDAYREKSGGKSLIQASIFIKNSINHKQGDKFLESVSKDIRALLDKPSLLTETLGQYSLEEMTALYGVAPAIAQAVIEDHNSLGLDFSYAAPNKENIDGFLSLFSVPETNEKIYY